jgi:hypothetical protein
MNDDQLGKLADEAATFGGCDRDGLLRLFKIVQTDTARECVEIIGESPDAIAAIRARFLKPDGGEG